jgi:proliferating cell nuclear antigen PCNA
MKFQIRDKKKKDLFISIFQVLKNCSNTICCVFDKETLRIQGMDKSHVCLFEVTLNQSWFDEYALEEKKIVSFDSTMFHSIISTKSDHQCLLFKMDDTDDVLLIDFLPLEEDLEVKSKKKDKSFKKFFKLPLTTNDYEELHIPDADYDAEFTICSKHIDDIFTQLGAFGNDIVMQCSEENIFFTTNGVTGEMRVQIPIDDVSSYSVVEGEELELTYSLLYLNKMCITNKLSEHIEFSLSNDCPMKIHYPLGEKSNMVFYMAPKVV